jgi:hypothetical protein
MKTTNIVFYIITLNVMICCNIDETKDGYYYNGDI